MVSVIIPVYNKKDTIAQCLDSILSNTYQDKEIIAVDDASTDGTVEILRRYVEKGIILIELSEHKGVSQACNAALSRANGDIIVRTDADTVVPPDWLILFDKYFQDRDIVAVGGAYGCLNQDSLIALCSSAIDLIFVVLLKRKLLFNKLAGANRAIRREALLSIGGFNGLSDLSEDIGVFLKLKKIGKVIFDPAIIVNTQYPGNLRQLCKRHYNNGFGVARYSKYPGVWLRPIFILIFIIYVFIFGIEFFILHRQDIPNIILGIICLAPLVAMPFFALFLLPKKRYLFILVPVIFLIQNVAYVLGMINCLRRKT